MPNLEQYKQKESPSGQARIFLTESQMSLFGENLGIPLDIGGLTGSWNNFFLKFILSGKKTIGEHIVYTVVLLLENKALRFGMKKGMQNKKFIFIFQPK